MTDRVVELSNGTLKPGEHAWLTETMVVPASAIHSEGAEGVVVLTTKAEFEGGLLPNDEVRCIYTASLDMAIAMWTMLGVALEAHGVDLPHRTD